MIKDLDNQINVEEERPSLDNKQVLESIETSTEQSKSMKLPETDFSDEDQDLGTEVQFEQEICDLTEVDQIMNNTL